MKQLLDLTISHIYGEGTTLTLFAGKTGAVVLIGPMREKARWLIPELVHEFMEHYLLRAVNAMYIPPYQGIGSRLAILEDGRVSIKALTVVVDDPEALVPDLRYSLMDDGGEDDTDFVNLTFEECEALFEGTIPNLQPNQP